MSEKRLVAIRNEDVGPDVIEGVYDSPTQAQLAANAWNKRYGTKPSDNGGAYVKSVAR